MNKTISVSAISLVLGLTGGYFVGREHVKYELRQIFSGIGDGISKSIKGEQKSLGQDKNIRLKIGDKYKKDDVSLSLTSISIENPKIYNTITHRTGSGDPCLLVKFEVQNLNERKVITFSRNKFSDQINAVDDVGNELKSLYRGFGEELVGAAESYSDINPGAEMKHTEAFSIPLPKTETVIVSFDLACLGKKGVVEFEIPESQIKQGLAGMKKVDAEEASADPQGAQAGGTAQPIVAQRVRDWGGGTSAPSATVVAVGDAVPTHVTALAGDLILTGTEGKVRLLGVKTPDSGTDSVRAREALSKLLGDGAVKIQLTSDRTAAVVWKDGRRINESMVRLGWSRSEMYPVAEAEAKRNRDGLWRSEGWTDPGTEGCEGPSKGAPTLPKVAQNSPETKAVDNQPSKLTDPPKTAAASTGEGATSTPLDTSSVPATQLDETSLKQQPGHVLVGKGVKINTARIQPPGPAALIEGVSSNPRIAVTFNTAGEVIKAEIIRSSGNIGWDHQVQLAMKLWTAEGEEMKKGGLVIRWTVLLGAEEPACLAPGQVTEPNTAPASAIPVENRRPVVQNLVFGQGEGVQAKPDYPREAQRRRQEGAVRIRLTVDETGKVTEAEVEEPCPFPLLNQAALSTVRKHWSFPAGPKRLYITTINFILQ